MAFKERLTSNVGRFAFLSIFERKDWGDDDKDPKFEATIMFENKDELKPVVDFVNKCVAERYGKKPPKGLAMPWKDGNECTNGDGEVYEGHEDMLVVKASSLFDLKQIVMADGKKFIQATDGDIKSGDYGQLILGAGCYEHSGNKGVSLYLVSICKTKDGDSLGGGGSNPDDLFGEVEDSDDMFG